MFRLKLPTPPAPLPQVPGPKLGPFNPTAHADIQFIEELGRSDKDADGLVWKVRLGGSETCYALKMFYFWSTEALKERFGSHLTRPLASPQHYHDFLDSFNRECRAYGRLKQEQREDLAIRAHGYLLLTPEQEADITARITGLPHQQHNTEGRLDGTNFWRRTEEHSDTPIRAIVKDLATDPYPFTPSHINTMWQDLEALHKLGILVCDVGTKNYRGGKLIDFSRSLTMPHPSLMYADAKYLDEERRREPHNLRTAIYALAIMEDWDCDLDIPEEMTKCASGRGETDRFGTDPRGYDWRKWEDDPEAADGFLAEMLVAGG